MSTTSSACPDPGVWRAWLDHEDSQAALQAHLDECAGCRGIVADLRGSAAAASDLLATLAPASVPSAAETAVALDRLSLRRRLPDTSPVPLLARAPVAIASRTRFSTSWRVAGGSLAAALVLSLLVAFTPEGRTAAASFLAQFRSQQLVAVNVTPQSQADIQATMRALGNLGTLQYPNGVARSGGDSELGKPGATLAEARQALGFAVETPDAASLPKGMDATPRVQIMPASQVRFTFDKSKARAYFQSTGHPEVSMPDRFDGATLVVSIPAATLLQYGSTSGAKDALVIGEAGELVVDVQGNVSLEEMRDFLLGLPGLPRGTVDQLRQIKNWNDTLPIPVPVDRVNWQQISVNGNQGLLLNDNSGVGSALIWHASGGRLFGMAGSLKAFDLQAIAATVKDRAN